jgi:hypothetical protein
MRKHSHLSISHQLESGSIYGIIIMNKSEKMLAKMRINPQDWKIDDLKKIADKFAIEYRQPGTSHVTFRTTNGDKLTVPAHKPIRAIYIKLFIKLIDGTGGKDE